MIVREIKEDIEDILKTFDYFNDYQDTRNYCLYYCPEAVPLLDQGNNDYWKARNAEMLLDENGNRSIFDDVDE